MAKHGFALHKGAFQDAFAYDMAGDLPIWLRVHSFDWLAFTVKLVWWAAVPGKWRVPNFVGTARHSQG